MKKVTSLFFALLLVFQGLFSPVHALANAKDVEYKPGIVTANHDHDVIPLFEEDSESSNLLLVLENGDNVEVLEILDDFSYVAFFDVESTEKIKGFIENKYLSLSHDENSQEDEQNDDLGNAIDTEESVDDDVKNGETKNENNYSRVDENEDNDEVSSDTDQSTENDENGEDINNNPDLNDTTKESEETNSSPDKSQQYMNNLQVQPFSISTAQQDVTVVGLRHPTNIRATTSTRSEIIGTFPQGSVIDVKTFSDNWYEYTTDDGRKGYIHHKHVDNIIDKPERFSGIGTRNPTNVRELASTRSDVKKPLPVGSIIELRTFSSNWYEALEGNEVIGYIHHKHIGDTVNPNQDSFKGIGINSPTNVRELPSTRASIIERRPIGDIIELKTFSQHWYQATTKNGQVGYIHQYHIGDTVFATQDSFQGIGINSPTNIRELPSTKANIAQRRPIGDIIKLKTFSKHWHQVTTENGSVIGYVHKNHIGDTVFTTQESFQGIGINSPTNIRSLPSTKASIAERRTIGDIIDLKTFSKHWYQATTKNGQTGYVHRNHIGDTVSTNREKFRGIGINNPTNIRALPNTRAKVAERAPVGDIINLETFSRHWYKATTSRGTEGYVHINHIGDKVFTKQDFFYGEALRSQTNIRALPSTQARVVKREKKDSLISLRTFSRHWHEVIEFNSNKRIGFVHRNHVNNNPDRVQVTETNYNFDFKNVVDIQMGRTPKADGAGRIPASRAQVEYYINSSNFDSTSTDYYQFLTLSLPAGLDADEVNQKILNDHGVLTGKAEKFIEAASEYNINEAYLISHAKLETGNGTSTLATGVPVDKNGNVTRDSKGDLTETSKTVTTVYNMYGIGAVDNNALEGGAKRAFDEGWDTVDKAIIGGAKFINTYITRGQDTLYKMRWNPANPGYPQYATDVGWAVKQTRSIAEIYDLLDNYTLIFDVPKYNNQPSSSGDPNEYINSTLLEIIAPKGVNIRDGAGTSYNIIDRVGHGNTLIPRFNGYNIITKNADGHVWYNINHNNINAWVSGGKDGTEYIKVIE